MTIAALATGGNGGAAITSLERRQSTSGKGHVAMAAAAVH